MYKVFLTLVLPLVIFSGCLQQELEFITPEYRYGQQKCFNDIAAIAHSSHISISSSSDSRNGERLKCDLDITLTNGAIQNLSKAELDSLSGLIAKVACNHINNIENFDWINVMFETDTGGTDGAITKGVKVFGVQELLLADGEKSYSEPVRRN